MAAAPLLLAIAFALATSVSWPFPGVLLGYFALTTAYSFALKRKMLVDVIMLAGLYSVLGGAVAIHVAVSEWLLAFCVMIFMALALIKRYVELVARPDEGLADPTTRNYRDIDIEAIAALAAAGFNAVTVFTLSVASEPVESLYSRPQILWLFIPLLLCWMARTLMLANRREMNANPIAFALKDRISLLAAGCALLMVVMAI